MNARDELRRLAGAEVVDVAPPPPCRRLDHVGIAHWCLGAEGHLADHLCRCGWVIMAGHEKDGHP